MVRQDILERKSTIGTYVHLGTQFYDEGTAGVGKGLDWKSLDDKTKGRVEAWAKFREDTGFVPRLIEKRCVAEVNGMKFGLTVDREGRFRNAEAVIDIKTSESFHEWWAIQLGGYALGCPGPDGLSPLALFHSRRRMIVQLFDNGKYKKHDFNDRRDADIFIAALTITIWKTNHGIPIRRLE